MQSSLNFRVPTNFLSILLEVLMEHNRLLTDALLILRISKYHSIESITSDLLEKYFAYWIGKFSIFTLSKILHECCTHENYLFTRKKLFFELFILILRIDWFGIVKCFWGNFIEIIHKIGKKEIPLIFLLL